MANLKEKKFPAAPGKNATKKELDKYVAECKAIGLHNQEYRKEQAAFDSMRKTADTLKAGKGLQSQKKKR